MHTSFSTDTTVLGGLPVTVEYSWAPAEPDVGIFRPYVTDWYITHVAGKPYRGTWIERRMTCADDEALQTYLEELEIEDDRDY